MYSPIAVGRFIEKEPVDLSCLAGIKGEAQRAPTQPLDALRVDRPLPKKKRVVRALKPCATVPGTESKALAEVFEDADGGPCALPAVPMDALRVDRPLQRHRRMAV